MVGRVQAIYVYPVKAAKGIRLEASLAEARGLLMDRLWMVVHADSGRFRSQRQMPKLALIQPSLPGSMAEVGGCVRKKEEGRVIWYTTTSFIR